MRVGVEAINTDQTTLDWLGAHTPHVERANLITWDMQTPKVQRLKKIRGLHKKLTGISSSHSYILFFLFLYIDKVMTPDCIQASLLVNKFLYFYVMPQLRAEG